MHVQRLTELAEWLEGGAKHETITFNMKEGIKFKGPLKDFDENNIAACKSSCCIAGAAVQFYNDAQGIAKNGGLRDSYKNGKRSYHLQWGDVSDHAQEVLELTYYQALALFTPGGFEHDRRLNNPKRAAKVIRHLIATGEVDWGRFLEEKV